VKGKYLNKIKLGISSCLSANKVRYDGGHKPTTSDRPLGLYGLGAGLPRGGVRPANSRAKAMAPGGRPGTSPLITIRTKVDLSGAWRPGREEGR